MSVKGTPRKRSENDRLRSRNACCILSRESGVDGAPSWGVDGCIDVFPLNSPTVSFDLVCAMSSSSKSTCKSPRFSLNRRILGKSKLKFVIPNGEQRPTQILLQRRRNEIAIQFAISIDFAIVRAKFFRGCAQRRILELVLPQPVTLGFFSGPHVN